MGHPVAGRAHAVADHPAADPLGDHQDPSPVRTAKVMLGGGAYMAASEGRILPGREVETIGASMSGHLSDAI